MAWVIISEGAYIWNRKSASKQALALPIKISFAFTGFKSSNDTGKTGSNKYYYSFVMAQYALLTWECFHFHTENA